MTTTNAKTISDDKTLVFETPKVARVTRAVTRPGTAYVAWITEIVDFVPGATNRDFGKWSWSVFGRSGIDSIAFGDTDTEEHARELAQRAVDLDLAIGKLRVDDHQRPLT